MFFGLEGLILYGFTPVFSAPVAAPAPAAVQRANMIGLNIAGPPIADRQINADPRFNAGARGIFTVLPPAANRAAVHPSFRVGQIPDRKGARVNADGSATLTATRVALAAFRNCENGKNVSIGFSSQATGTPDPEAMISGMFSLSSSSILTARGLKIGGNVDPTAESISLAGTIVANSAPARNRHMCCPAARYPDRNAPRQRLREFGSSVAHRVA